MVEAAGMCGVLAGPEDPRAQLLVTDDEALELLAEMLPEIQAGMIRVFGRAPRCAQFVTNRLGWRFGAATAMVRDDLHTVRSPSALPTELTLEPVRRLADDGGGVALADAVAAAMSAAPGIEDPPEVFAEFLRSLPDSFRLLAAVDRDGKIRATSGYGVFDQYATVIFVNTDPDWRGRGIGQMMTAQALSAAQRAGATRACLDASDVGRSIYLRLGFRAAGRLTRFREP